MGQPDIVSYCDFPDRFPENATKSWYRKLKSTGSMRHGCKNVPSRPIDLFSSFCWSYSAWLLYVFGCFLLSAATTQVFSQSLPSHILCRCLETFLLLKTSAISGKTISKKSGPTRFAAGTTYIRKKKKCGPATILFKCTESPAKLSTNNTCIKKNLHLSRSGQYCKVFLGGNEVWRFFFKTSNENECCRQKQGVFFQRLGLSSQKKHWKKILSSGLNCKILKVC